MSEYYFTNNWFEYQKPIITNILNQYIDTINPISILEIRAYEGRSTCFYIDNYANHSNSRITSIDPFDTTDSTSPVCESTLNLFISNISKSKFPHKSRLIKNYSKEALSRLLMEGKSFDIIIIDGSHKTENVLLDACLSFHLIDIGGIIFFDDYLGGTEDRDTDLNVPKIGIDCFLKCFNSRLKIIHSGYHLAIQKTV